MCEGKSSLSLQGCPQEEQGSGPASTMLPPLLLACLVAQAAAQCPKEDILIGPGDTFSGSVEVHPLLYVLEGDSGGIPDRSGIHVVAGCKDQQVDDDVVISIAGEEGNKYFVLNDNQERTQNKLIQLKDEFKTSLNFPLPETLTFSLEVHFVKLFE